jgi:glutamine amidotransferase
MIGILDYGVGNVGAFLRIFHYQNIPVMPISSAKDFELVDKIILPGVGSFDTAMRKLNESGLRDVLDKKVLEEQKPLLAVCIGMHMLGNSSEEGSLPGLGYIAGVTKNLTNSINNKALILPHMGWNDILINTNVKIWNGIRASEGFYFLHSFVFCPDVSTTIIGNSNYGANFTCAVKSSNIYGFQFHPEKSLSNGLRLLKNFAEQD